jgi:DNA-directed RNA polymerase II subunit RPB7
LKKIIIDKLKDACENKIFSKIDGFLIKIMRVHSDKIEYGSINDINGEINYKIYYDAVVFKPIKNDKIEVLVSECNDFGIWGICALLPDNPKIEIIIPKNYISNNFNYNEDENIWYSNNIKIQKGSEIEAIVLNVQIDVTKMLIIAKIL